MSTLALAALLTPQRCRATAFLQRPESQLIQLDAATLSRRRIPYARVDLEDALWQGPPRSGGGRRSPASTRFIEKRARPKAENRDKSRACRGPRRAGAGARVARRRARARRVVSALLARFFGQCLHARVGAAVAAPGGRRRRGAALRGVPGRLQVRHGLLQRFWGERRAACRRPVLGVALAAPAPELLPRLAADYASKVNALADPTRSSSAAAFRARSSWRCAAEPRRADAAPARGGDGGGRAPRGPKAVRGSAARARARSTPRASSLDWTRRRRDGWSRIYSSRAPELDKAELPSLEVPDGRRPAELRCGRRAAGHHAGGVQDAPSRAACRRWRGSVGGFDRCLWLCLARRRLAGAGPLRDFRSMDRQSRLRVGARRGTRRAVRAVSSSVAAASRISSSVASGSS